jgi:hypothetical protein
MQHEMAGRGKRRVGNNWGAQFNDHEFGGYPPTFRRVNPAIAAIAFKALSWKGSAFSLLARLGGERKRSAW